MIDISSAIGNAYQTALSFPVNDRRYAAGKRITSCLHIATIAEYVPTPSLIIEEISKFYNIQPDRIKVANRSKDVVVPRQVCSYILQQLTDLSLKQIGSELGGQHYTTVISSINKVKAEMRDNPEFANTVKDLISNLSDGDGN